MNGLKHDYIGNIWKLYVIKVARNAMFMMPIITLFFQERGLTMTEIMLLQSVFAVAIVLLEVPSGYLADIFSRKTLITIALFFAALGDLLYGFAYGFWMMLIAELLLALAGAFLSGADSALLYDSLKSSQKEDEYLKYESRLFSSANMAEATGAILGGFIAVYSMVATFFLSAFIIFLSIPVALSLKEPPREKISKNKKHSKEIFNIIKFAIHSNKKIKWLIIYSSTVGASTLVAVWLLQPYFKLLNIPIAYFGILWATFNASAAAFALFANKLEKSLGLQNTLIFLAIAPAIAHIALYKFTYVWALIFVFLYYMSFALSGPIIKDYINREIDSKIRASVLSVYSLFSRFVFIVFSPFIGYFADIYSLQSAFLASAVIFGILSLIPLSFLIKNKP